MTTPSYIALHESGELRRRAKKLVAALASCTICPRDCEVNRLGDELGFCRSGLPAKVSSFNAHFGEEAPLVGQRGSGTIFMTNCNLGCLYCQNCDISHMGHGREVTSDELAGMMLTLQQSGCHNINFVTPSHFVPQILQGLDRAVARGPNVPLVYNTGGYDKVETLKHLDGVFDIYMPDAKYSDPEAAEELSRARDYPEVMRAALREMHRQVGDLELDERGIAVKGLLVRHLVLPEGLAGTPEIMEFLASLSPNTYVNVMAQYRPCYRADEHPKLARGLTSRDYQEAVQTALAAGLSRLDERRPRLFVF